VRTRRLIEKLTRRSKGIPRNITEFQRSLNVLATLRDLGWQRSAIGAPVDSDGAPIPFLNYPLLAWLEPHLRPTDRVFEYGSGHSTLWFAQRAHSVVAVDHHPRWVASLKSRLPSNSHVELRSGENYVSALSALPHRPDIVLIDGILRHRCAEAAAEYVARDGLILFDNSDRLENHDSVLKLGGLGFFRMDFTGLIPGFAELSSASVFFRDDARWLRPAHAPVHLGWEVPGQQGGLAPAQRYWRYRLPCSTAASKISK
jgi:hypothetical protein